MSNKTLPQKTDLNFRKVGNAEVQRCARCAHFVKRFKLEGYEAARCRVIGMEKKRNYRVYADHVCDRFEEVKYATH
jgi:hypothetical protein